MGDEDTDMEDCYLSDDQEDYYDYDEDDTNEETVLEVLEREEEKESRLSVPSVITKESLLAAQKEDLRKVMELLGLTEQHARTLLIFYRWDVVRIFDFLERMGKERLFLESGVSIKTRMVSIPRSVFTCEVCFEETPPDAVTEMDCGHCFCNGCWTEHFILKITEGQSRRITCMAPKCNAICDEAIVRNLVGIRNPDIAIRFDDFLLRSYIDDNSKVKWCPSVPHCGNAVRVDGEVHCEVECKCGLQFCFACLSEPHSPCSCKMWKLWKKKCEDESETVNYLTVNTKNCPKCFKPVEKNGGCNLVVCVCKQAFCWLCGGATGRAHTWNSIEGHTCGSYKEEHKYKAERAKHELLRYSHYHNRCKAHTDSLKQESNLKESIKLKVSISENKESIIKDYDWVMDACNRLFRMRRILSYSYAFAFYMFGDELKDEMTPQERELKQFVFEDQQQKLESYVEQLSMSLEQDFQEFSDFKILETKTQVLRLSNDVDRMCKSMYHCIENDLLYPLEQVHDIAPYKPKGLERASELSVGSSSSLSEPLIGNMANKI